LLNEENQQEKATFQLHKEKLQISKNWVKTADVKVYKNIYTEVKEIKVPITHEELVIEKKEVSPIGISDEHLETIRIPLSEERIEVTLTPTIIENVEISKEQIERIIRLNETVKEEKVHVETIGDVKVTSDNSQLRF
jgi:uncharacterized protein (TIGR02271 family)